MRIAYCSDVHFDIWFNVVGELPNIINDCAADVLILAGDINEYFQWSIHFHQKIINMLCDRFDHVILIDGNHEYYNLDFESDEVYDILKDSPSNLNYLRNESVTINGVTFYGGTFWTNPQNWSPLEKFDIEKMIGDFTHIRGISYEKMTESHNGFIENLCELTLDHSDIVVISHFPPTEQSIDPRYIGHMTNAYFVNSCFEQFYGSNQIKHWICGHVHHKHDFEIGNIKGHCNPVGYPREENQFILEYFDI